MCSRLVRAQVCSQNLHRVSILKAVEPKPADVRDVSMPLSSRAGAVRTGLRRRFNAHRDGPSPKVNRQDLHLDERAHETGLGEFRGLRSRFAPRTAPVHCGGLAARGRD